MVSENANARAHVLVDGRVQGVFYRANTKEKARSFGLTGWVRNCIDGRVEAVFEGHRRSIEGMIQWCGEGPPSAHVEDVAIKWEEYTGEFNAFDIRY